MGSGSSRRRGPAGRAGQSRDPPGTAPADGEGAAAPPGPGYRAPAAGGSAEPRSGGSGAEAAGGGGEAPLQQAALSPRSPPSPENNNLDHHFLLRSYLVQWKSDTLQPSAGE
ncbi:cystin-1 isoform X3 [Ammospiza nelsoni]|uniref:cystin-1 isoform X3 n=1 Tax=Ammospiza nelsoni TaxID=2857394 RepID=UPI00286A95A7|nr:cystin-1 isoform X3 [Ammospiza nelsoni]